MPKSPTRHNHAVTLPPAQPDTVAGLRNIQLWAVDSIRQHGPLAGLIMCLEDNFTEELLLEGLLAPPAPAGDDSIHVSPAPGNS